jgi:hypothetical protein
VRKPIQKDLRKLDPESQEYWEEVLRREGLNHGAGNNHDLIYVGDTQILERIEGELRTHSGQVVPKGSHPD